MTDAKSRRSGGKEKKPLGRPRMFSSPDEFNALVDSYIDLCKSSQEHITLTGLILSLGLASRESLDKYLTYPEFVDSVKRAKMFIEHEYEKRLITSSSATGSIFALKNFGWVDKMPTELERLQAEKLRKELAHGEDDPDARPESVVVVVEDASKNGSQ